MVGQRNLLLMVDNIHALQDPVTTHVERGELQRDWIVCRVRSPGQEALTKAAEVLSAHIPGRRPDNDLAQAWAAVGQGWATLSHTEAARRWQLLL